VLQFYLLLLRSSNRNSPAMPLHLVHLLPIVLVQHQHQVALANLILAPVHIYAIMLGEVDSSMWEQVLIDCDRGFYARLGLVI